MSRRAIGPSSRRGGFLRDIASFGALALFITALVWLAASAGELVALWRMGTPQ